MYRIYRFISKTNCTDEALRDLYCQFVTQILSWYAIMTLDIQVLFFLFFRNIFNFYRQIWCTNWHNATLVHIYYFLHIYNWYGNIYIFKMSIFYTYIKINVKKKLSKIVNVWELKPKWLNLYTQIHIGNVMELKNKTKFKYIKSF